MRRSDDRWLRSGAQVQVKQGVFSAATSVHVLRRPECVDVGAQGRDRGSAANSTLAKRVRIRLLL